MICDSWIRTADKMITFELKYLINPELKPINCYCRLRNYSLIPFHETTLLSTSKYHLSFLKKKKKINNIETLNVFNKGHWKSDHNQNQFLFPFTVTVYVILSLTVLDVKYDQDSCVTLIICYLLPTACGDSGP